MSTLSLSETIQELLKREHLLSAKQIVEFFAHQGHSYNKTSVYRALDQLATENLICRYDFNDKEAQYELRSEHHDHLICESCGKIVVADCQFTEPKIVQGFHLSHHHLTMFGQCEICEKKSEK